MLRWFEEDGKNGDVVISSRVRLARNLKDYNFSLKINEKDALAMIKKVMESVKMDFKDYEKYDFKNLDAYQKMSMRERFVISSFLAEQKEAAGLVSPDERISIMINEEDHIRIQSYMPGMDMYAAYKNADKIDNIIGKHLEYAYDDKYGYLTTCLSNAGTGMRASYILHLPSLTDNNKIEGLSREVGRFGLALKSVYGDSNNGAGDIYKLSNLVTLGVSEEDIINNLTNICDQITMQERTLRSVYVQKRRVYAEDAVFRSYGILRYARKLSLKDAMLLLSQIRFGIYQNLVKFSDESNGNVFQLMIGIQPANLCLTKNRELTEEEIEVERASFIRDNLPLIQ